MLIGYVRVSTNDQNTALQRNALECAGCELIFEDKISGRTSDRPGLKRVLRTLSEGDTLVVWKLSPWTQHASSGWTGGRTTRARYQL